MMIRTMAGALLMLGLPACSTSSAAGTPATRPCADGALFCSPLAEPSLPPAYVAACEVLIPCADAGVFVGDAGYCVGPPQCVVLEDGGCKLASGEAGTCAHNL